MGLTEIRAATPPGRVGNATPSKTKFIDERERICICQDRPQVHTDWQAEYVTERIAPREAKHSPMDVGRDRIVAFFSIWIILSRTGR